MSVGQRSAWWWSTRRNRSLGSERTVTDATSSLTTATSGLKCSRRWRSSACFLTVVRASTTSRVIYSTPTEVQHSRLTFCNTLFVAACVVITSSVAAWFGRHGMPPPRPPPTLIFDRLTLKLLCESHLRWGTFFPNLGTLGLWVLELFAMYSTDGQTDRRTDGRTKQRLLPLSLR